MVTVNVFQTQFTNDEWDAMERALIVLLDVAGMRPGFVSGLSTDDLVECKRLSPHAQSALLKVELGEA